MAFYKSANQYSPKTCFSPSSETKTNKELGGEYWTKSHDLHMKEDDLPTLENYAIGHNRATLDNRATLARLVERDVDV